MDELVVIFLSIEAREYLHLVDDVSLLLRLLALKLLYFLQVQQPSVDDKLLSPDSLVEPCVVELDDAVLEVRILWSVILEELHVREE